MDGVWTSGNGTWPSKQGNTVIKVQEHVEIPVGSPGSQSVGYVKQNKSGPER